MEFIKTPIGEAKIERVEDKIQQLTQKREDHRYTQGKEEKTKHCSTYRKSSGVHTFECQNPQALSTSLP